MTPIFSSWDRRQFLAWNVAFAAIISGHGSLASASPEQAGPSKEPEQTGPRILRLDLLTSTPLDKMKAFYGQTLGLPILDEQAECLTIGAGATRLTFLKTEPDNGDPFYHFAFNIPENTILSARTWQLRRTPLIPIPERLRDPKYPVDVVNYSHWNAHAIFFLDPGGNVVEYIARHDLKNGAQGAFGSKDILYISEIGLIVEDVLTTAAMVKHIVGVDPYRGSSEQFTAMGDEHGLLLVMQRGRILNFNPSSHEKAARVFPTKVCARGDRAGTFPLPEYPYVICIER